MKKIKDKYFSMNDAIRQKITAWCKTWDDDMCQNCSIPFSELEHQERLNVEMGGEPRILPVYTIDHIDNDSSHNDGYIDVDSDNNPLPLKKRELTVTRIHHKYGNCRRLCWSCNRIQGHIKRKTTGSTVMTREKQDRINNEEKFLFETENQINEREHICYKAMTKAGKSICDSSEVTCQRYLDTEIRTPENPKAKFTLFNYTCDGKYCNGTHVCWAGIKPDVIIQEEKTILEREWQMQYTLPSGYEHDEAIRQWANKWENMGKKWIPKEAYVRERLQLSWN